MKKKYLIIGVCFCTVVLLVLGSLSNVVGYQTIPTPEATSNITIDIITYKQRFPRIYIENSDFNATIHITNNGINTINDLDVIITLSQFPTPRVSNEYYTWEFNLILEPDKSHATNFHCNPTLMTPGHIGIFPLSVSVDYDNELVYRHKIFIICSPIINRA
ncbi:MAG: hypothetical protein WC525_00055 [Candidatus Thermoplasmatota archaeon]